MSLPSDGRWLTLALAQADNIIAHTAENPAVGCAIIDAQGCLVGVGHTAFHGRPHAEVVALGMAGDRANGGTAYVTLEPCSHHGQTGPCADALIQAGIARVVIACPDPDSRVSGKGIARLKEAGINVLMHPHEKARRQMAGFLSYHEKNRPFIMVKMATSRDGFIAARRDKQTWLTGAVASRYVHDLRSRYQVILTTSGTIAADDPSLNVRSSGYDFPQPALAILDSEARLAVDAKCLQANRPVFLYHKKGAALKRWPAHLIPIAIEASPDGLSLPQVLGDLQARSYYAVMVEAGARLFESLHAHQLIDELQWLRAPHNLESGVLAWQSDDKMDFCAPDHYIMSSSTNLGADDAFILHPAQK